MIFYLLKQIVNIEVTNIIYYINTDNKKTNKKKALMRGTGLEARDKRLNLLESRKNERGNKYQGSSILQDNPMVK